MSRRAPRFAHLGVGPCKRSKDGKHVPVHRPRPTRRIQNWSGVWLDVPVKDGSDVRCERCGADLWMDVESLTTT